MNPAYSSENLPSDEHNPNTFLAKMIVRMKVASRDLLTMVMGSRDCSGWGHSFGGVNIQLGQISKCICKNLTFVGDKIPCRFIIQQMLQFGLNDVVIICIKN